jgi:localization factor PodJL
MSVGDWLNTAIVQSAADDGVHPDEVEQDTQSGELASVNDRLDHLTQQIERVVALTAQQQPAHVAPRTPDDWGRRNVPPQYFSNQPYPPQYPEPPAYTYAAPHPQSAPQYAPAPEAYPPQRPAYSPRPQPMPAYAAPDNTGIDDFVAEIAARQRALDDNPAAAMPAPPEQPYEQPYEQAYGQHLAEMAAPQAAAPPPASPAPRPAAPQQAAAPQSAPHQAPPQAWPTQDLSGLESLLRNITGQIESLHRSSNLDAAVAALREDLSEIARAILDAMPRQAVEALQNDVHMLAHKIEQTRQVGVDPHTIAGMEQGLAEVRDALHSLTPAENLAGFAEAVTGLSHKIDQMGGGVQDPAYLHQLDAAIEALRGVVSHVASNEALTRLADEMRELSSRIDRVGDSGAGMSAGAFSALEDRIGALTEQLKHRSDGNALPPQLDDVIRTLTDRLERVHLSPGDNVALGHLEDRIVNLVEKLDASEARLSHLSAVERGLADLLVHLEELRADKNSAGLGSANLNSAGLGSIGLGSAGLREPTHTQFHEHLQAPDVDILQREVERAQDSIEDVHGTLGDVVDRLAMIETDIRGEAPRPTVTTTARPVVVNPIQPSEPASKPAQQRPNPAAVSNRQPIDPNLPPDYPLEPGSGTPRMRAQPSAAERIAASEAALGGVKPATTSAGHTDFISAARRAAAQSAPAGATITPPPAETEKSAKRDGDKTIGKRVRSLLTGLGAIIIIFGAIKLATSFLDRSEEPVLDAPATREVPKETSKETSKPSAEPGQQSWLQSTPEKIASTTPTVITAPPPAAPQWLPDVTGSIPPTQPAPARSSALPPPPAAAQALPPVALTVEADKLPAALRQAIARGDSTAEYEAGLRYLEGKGVSVNLEEAARWLDRAAKAGLAPAQFRLGSLYEKGQGVKKDTETARRLYVAAADKGNAKAMHNLAVLQAEGVDGKPDYKAAAQWFRKGADRGIADSQYNLGILYARGIGVEANLAESYKWFALAADQGDKESAKKRDEIAQRLDQQTLITARLSVQTWTAEPQPSEAVNVRVPPGGWERGEAGPAPAKKQRASALMKIGQQ